MTFDVEVKELEAIEELEGKLAPSGADDKLMRSVLQNDRQRIDDGKLIGDAVNRGLQAFTPDLLFANLTSNFRIAKQLYGERIIRLVSGHDANYIERNLAIPEFKRQLQQNIKQRIEGLKDAGFLGSDGEIIEKGITFSTLVLYLDELDRIEPRGTLGEREHHQKSKHGEQHETRRFRKGDRFKDIAIRATIREATRRGHKRITTEDLRAADRESKGTIHLIYGLDASASMKGEKLETAKKSGVALAYEAIQHRDQVGLIVFGREVTEAVPPTQDFRTLLDRIGRIRASRETDYTKMFSKAIELFSGLCGTKHLTILTDALPTVGKEPEAEALRAASNAHAAGITISVIGINLDKNGTTFAKQLADIGEGRFILATNLNELDRIVLQEYEAVANGT